MLGDFAFGGAEQVESYVKRLRGRIAFIKGNHDSGLLQWAKRNNIYVPDSLTIKTLGEQFYLSHYAHRVWDRSHYGVIHLFGHSHGNLEDHNLSMDVGMDCNNFHLFLADDIIAKMGPIRERLIQEGKIFVSRK